jgi:hypothetical protein
MENNNKIQELQENRIWKRRRTRKETETEKKT